MCGGKKEFYKKHFVYRKIDTVTITQHFGAAANKSNRNLLKMAGKTGRILDVGCGFGAFVKYSLDKGYDAYGVDFNDDRIKAGRKLFGLGERLIPGNVRDLQNLEHFRNSFDLVTLFEVIEHVDDPAGLVKDSREMLRDGGLLAISCPNEARWQPMGRIFADYPPHHLTRWRPDTLRRFLQKCGFEHVRTELDCSFINLIWVAYVNRSAKKKQTRPFQDNQTETTAGLAHFRKFKKTAFSLLRALSTPLDLVLKAAGVGTMGMRVIFRKV
jgi:2-polyprenyl-3-methyl-5-hydroxy-6-metoxy-1,4-benzoquinol methylase